MTSTPSRQEMEEQIRALEETIRALEQKDEEYRLNEIRMGALIILQKMTGASLNEITDFAMESAVALTRSAIGYIAFINEEQDLLTMHSWSREAMKRCAMETKPIHYPIEQTGLWGEAVRERKPVITNDYQVPSPFRKGYPEGHVHLTRHMNVPIMEYGRDGDRIVIVAGVANKPADYDDSDVKQVQLLMQGTWNLIQRKKAMDELRGQKELLEGVLDAISDVINIQHPDRVIECYNRAGYEMLGITHDQLGGRKCYELMGRDEGCDNCPTQQAVEKKQPASVEKYIPELNRWLDCRSNLILDENGEVVKIIQQLRDITEKKQADAEKEMLHSQLHQSRKMEALGTLTGGVAHDFNNILTVISGHTEMISDDLSEMNPCQKNLGEIKTACMRAQNIVKHLLSFCKRGEIQQVPQDMGRLTREALEAIRPRVTPLVSFRADIPDNLPLIIVDSGQVRQVVAHLCKNALDAMEQDGGDLDITLEPTRLSRQETGLIPGSRPGDYLKLTVRDTGHGIEAKDLDRIFDPYFTTKEIGKGAGLGLAMVLGIVKRHQGAIRVKSDAGKGTTVEVFFPVAGK